MANRLTTKQRALLEFLRKRAGQIVTDTEILEITGWKQASWRVYLNNGLHAPYLKSTAPGSYRVTMDPKIAEQEFRDQVTQTKRSSRFQDPLAQALIKRSRDNIVLALEAYNRPSLVNRLDAFAMLFCTAWEQLLKAELIEAHGQETIFKPKKPNRRRESVSLDECLQRVFPDPIDPVRLNLERIAELRHAATHLVMPEIQPVYSRLFQAGVLVYARRVLEKTGQPLVPRQNVGLLALAADEETLDAAPLAKLYGDEIAAEMVTQAKTIEEEIKKVGDGRFAIPIEYTLRFATKGEEADVTLVHAAEAPANAVVFEKPVDPERTHPLRTRQLQHEVAARLKCSFSGHDLQCVLTQKGWKKSDNEFHRLQRNPDTRKFSHKAVNEIVRSIEGDSDYLRRVRESYRRSQKTGGKRTEAGAIAATAAVTPP